jgi:hypothetical protein
MEVIEHCFTPREGTPVPIEWGLVGYHNWSGHSGENKNLLPLPGIKSLIVKTVA